MRKLFLLLVLLSQNLFAQKEITYKNLTDGTFRERSVNSVNWMNDGRYYSALAGNQVIKFDIKSGEAIRVLADGNALGITIDDYAFSADEKQMLLLTDRQSVFRRSYTALYYLYNIETKTFSRLAEGRQAYATFSPDGSKIAFTRENDLFYINLTNKNEIRITEDGEQNAIINGSSDWVYEEELYITKAFEWSGDGSKIAFYRFDESKVRQYNMQVWEAGALYPRDYIYKYPKAGEDNAMVDIYVYHLDDKKKVKADIGEETDIYIPRIYWTQDANVLSIQRLNRLQNQLDILHINAEKGTSKVILTDKSSTYIDFTFCDDLTYLDNGREFLFSSEQDGYKHFYLYRVDGQLIRQVTSGEYEATTLVGLDQGGKVPMLYYLSTEDSPMEQQLYVLRLDGKGKRKLSTNPGISRIDMSTDCKYYIDYRSSTSNPLQVKLYQSRGNKMIKVLEDNADLANRIGDYQPAEKEFFTFETVDGTSLNGFYLKPGNFDASKKYPVLLYQYSGPGSQNVSNSWGGRHFAWHQMLVQKGYIVAVIDSRGTGFRGEHFKKLTYKQLGKYEVEDHIAAAKYLGGQAFIDKNRIGIWGWSYGGYISSLSIMKGADVFKAAIAVAPVTTWRFYDTIYTERYLQRPQDNANGYDDNSPIQHVEKLKGNFLLIHGTGDDNVHFQNAVTLQNKLIEAGKQFDAFYYPDKAHGLSGRRGHLYEMMTRFILEKL